MTLGIVPDIDWLWTLALATIGLLFFAVGGFDKFTLVGGAWFLAASGLSVLRQTGRLPLNTEIPILVITAGVLLLVARFPAVPTPEWVIPRSAQKSGHQSETGTG